MAAPVTSNYLKPLAYQNSPSTLRRTIVVCAITGCALGAIATFLVANVAAKNSPVPALAGTLGKVMLGATAVGGGAFWIAAYIYLGKYKDPELDDREARLNEIDKIDELDQCNAEIKKVRESLWAEVKNDEKINIEMYDEDYPKIVPRQLKELKRKVKVQLLLEDYRRIKEAMKRVFANPKPEAD